MITVKVTDHAGNVTEERLSREGIEPVPGEAAPTGADTTPPDVGFFGSAVKAVEEGATTGSYELHIAATDGSPSAPQSGVSKIEVRVDGTTLQSWEKYCPVGSCPLEVTWPYQPGNFPGEGHVLTVTIRDHAGNVTTRTIEPTEFPQALAAWSFDEGSGTVAHDVTGNGHDGTLSAKGVVWAEGKYGGALKFDGKEGCVTVPDSPALRLHEGFTLEAWIRPEGELVHLPALTKQAEGLPAYGLGVGMTTAGRAEGQIGTATRSHTDVASPSSVPANEWTHEAITFDGTNLRLYLNGTLVATQAAALPAAGVAGLLEIGCSASGHFLGRIDEVRIYNRALNGEEVIESMQPPPNVKAGNEMATVEETEALMTGTVNPMGVKTAVSFEYGTTKAYGSIWPPSPALNEHWLTGHGTSEVEQAIDELQPATTYHYRVVATSANGRTAGPDQTFTTSPAQPQARTAVTPNAIGAGQIGMNWSGSSSTFTDEEAQKRVLQSGARIFRSVIYYGKPGHIVEGVDERVRDRNWDDQLFTFMAQHGIKVLPDVSGVPGVGIPNNEMPPWTSGEYSQVWENGLKFLVERYGPEG